MINIVRKTNKQIVIELDNVVELLYSIGADIDAIIVENAQSRLEEISSYRTKPSE